MSSESARRLVIPVHHSANAIRSPFMWPVVYYRSSDGREPVNDFIDGLDPRTQAIVDNQIERLELFGPRLPFPHSSQVEGELRELRCHHRATLYRILYCRSHNLFVLLHALAKSSRKLPPREIEIALSRWDDFKRRMDEDPRRPPRAAGHDAP